MRGAGLLFATAVLATQGQALTPLAGPEEYGAVCDALGRLATRAEEMVEAAQARTDVRAEMNAYTDALMSLGFSAETRATVDADDLDPLLGAGEGIALTPGLPIGAGEDAGLWAALDDFAKTYRCKIIREG